jgi:integrase
MHARVEHVDFRNGTWFIPISKSTAGRRRLKLVPEALAIMQARVAAANQSGWLFEEKAKGTHLSDVENSHLKILKNTALAFMIYDLRHRADFLVIPTCHAGPVQEALEAS